MKSITVTVRADGSFVVYADEPTPGVTPIGAGHVFNAFTEGLHPSAPENQVEMVTETFRRAVNTREVLAAAAALVRWLRRNP